jgi:hypothetical protein
MKIIQLYDIGKEDRATTALYIDSQLVMFGDYYHDKIHYKIAGFTIALKYMKVEFSFKEYKYEEESEDGIPPDVLPEKYNK